VGTRGQRVSTIPDPNPALAIGTLTLQVVLARQRDAVLTIMYISDTFMQPHRMTRRRLHLLGHRVGVGQVDADSKLGRAAPERRGGVRRGHQERDQQGDAQELGHRQRRPAGSRAGLGFVRGMRGERSKPRSDVGSCWANVLLCGPVGISDLLSKSFRSLVRDLQVQVLGSSGC
jgi:hypothetical protein